MTITARHAHRRLIKHWRLLDNLALTLPEAIHNARTEELAQLNDTTPSEGGRSKSHISDPTGETGTKIADAGTTDHWAVEQSIDTIGISLRELTRYVHEHTGIDLHDETQHPEHRRCGQYTPNTIKQTDWYTTPNQRGRTPAECTDDALYSVANDGTITWATHGLCPADYQTMRRALIDDHRLNPGEEWIA